MVLLTSHIFTTLTITSLIWISPIWTLNSYDRRYDGYDLERGPVFYEAYYPENNDNNPSEYQEKRYFDRDAVIERTFQIPTDRKEYLEDRSKNEYLNRLEYLRYDNSYNPDSKLSRTQNYPKIIGSSRNYEIPRKFYNANPFSPNYIKLIRNIPEDSSSSGNVEHWNSLENYLRFDPNLGDRRNLDKSDINSRSNFRGIPDRGFLNQGNMFEMRNDNRKVETIRDIRQNLSAASSRAIQPLEIPKEFDSIRRLSTRDLQNHNSFDGINSVNYMRYPGQEYNYFGNGNDPESQKWIPQDLSNEQMEGIPSNVNSLPSENIFAPRPQVINYVFSKDSSIERTEKPITTINDITNNDEPRRYGDNLLQEELNKKKEDKDKNTEVTSIEVSEIPRHKIRHHHGEWLRNFSRGQK